MSVHGDMLEALGSLVDAVKDARQAASNAGSFNVVNNLDKCFEVAMEARLWAIKEISPWNRKRNWS